MSEPNFILLYVKNAPASAAFYSELLTRAPVQSSPGFVMFALDSGLRLGLWSAETVEPAPMPAGGGELAFEVADAAAVRATHGEWQHRGLPILQAPTRMSFGDTFVAGDPDGHRLRVFAPLAG